MIATATASGRNDGLRQASIALSHIGLVFGREGFRFIQRIFYAGSRGAQGRTQVRGGSKVDADGLDVEKSP